MSGSRPSTGTPDLSFNITTHSTTSRIQAEHEDTSTQPAGEGTPKQDTTVSNPSHSFKSPLPEEVGASSSLHPVHRAGTPLEQPMAKRLRRARTHSRSSLSTDSQGGLADIETDVRAEKKPRGSDPFPQVALPPKKKRTRTLTTPHQSEVLHALLAQSRFPSTAVREEVGRSIGLSARKVQIWFQNQRQKARRPRNQGEPSPDQSGKYGRFSNTQDFASMSSFAVGPAQSSSMLQSPHVERSYRERQDEAVAVRTSQSSETFSSPSEPPPRLLGPGMPGAELYSHPSPVRRQKDIAAPGGLSETRSALYSAYTSGEGFNSGRGRSPATRPTSHHARHSSRVLPPLPPRRPSTSSLAFDTFHTRSAHRVSSYSPFSTSIVPPRPSSPGARFAHYLPEATAQAQPSAGILPPPFTLEPRPQWDFLSNLARPSSSSSAWPAGAGSYPTGSRSVSPLSLRRDPGLAVPVPANDPPPSAERLPHSETTLPPIPTISSRAGRYDPVRATFIPYSTPVTKSPGTPGSQSDREQSREDH